MRDVAAGLVFSRSLVGRLAADLAVDVVHGRFGAVLGVQLEAALRSRISLETLLLGSSRSPKVSALAWQVLTQAGVASRSMPGLSPLASP